MTKLAIAIALFLVQSHAQATVCGPRSVIVDQLGTKYGETRQGATMMDDVFVFELWASEETGSWSILQVNTKGQACLIKTGNDFVPKVWGVGS